MTKKIVLLLLLAGFAAIATEALSQSPSGASPAPHDGAYSSLTALSASGERAAAAGDG